MPRCSQEQAQDRGPLSPGATGWAGSMNLLGEKGGEEKAGGERGELTSLRMDLQGRP